MTTYHAEPSRRSNCGSVAGFGQHVKYHERACDPCRNAQRIYTNAYYIRTGRYDQRRMPVELVGALFAACADETVKAQVLDLLSPEVVEACVGRLEAARAQADKDLVELVPAARAA